MLKNEVEYLKPRRIYGLTNPYNAAEYTEERQTEEIILKFSLTAYREADTNCVAQITFVFPPFSFI